MLAPGLLGRRLEGTVRMHVLLLLGEVFCVCPFVPRSELGDCHRPRQPAGSGGLGCRKRGRGDHSSPQGPVCFSLSFCGCITRCVLCKFRVSVFLQVS